MIKVGKRQNSAQVRPQVIVRMKFRVFSQGYSGYIYSSNKTGIFKAKW